jgi:hypothetical protein
MKSFALVLASVFAASFPCQAELVYDFSFTSTSAPIQSFSFSIDSPGFIVPGSPDIAPFTITDGSHVWTLDQDLVGISTGVILGSTLLPAGDGCFAFGSSGAVLTNNGCGVAIPNQGTSEAAFVVDLPGGLPSSTGTFSNLLFDAIAVLEPSFTEEGFYNCCGGSDGAMQLNITQTPEPSSFALLAMAICLCGTFLLTARQNRFRQVS